MTKRRSSEKPARVEGVQANSVGATLLVKDHVSEFKVTLPPGARVTFGPTIPYQQKPGNFREDKGYSLRVYATKANDSLIAVFAGVEWFRDITMPLHRLIVREAGKTVWRSDETGYKVEEEVSKTREWGDELKQLAEPQPR